MKMRNLIPLAALAPLAAGCAVGPPVALPLVAYPAANRTAEAFGADDAACRQEADRTASAVPGAAMQGAAAQGATYGSPPPAAAPVSEVAAPAVDPNSLYLSCMASRGNVVAPAATAGGYTPYPYPSPAFYPYPAFFYATTYPVFWGYPYRFGYYGPYRSYGWRGGYYGHFGGYRGGFVGYRGGYGGGYRGGYGGGYRGGYRGGYGGGFRGRGGRR